MRPGSSKSVRSKSSTRSRASEDGQQQKQWTSVSEVYLKLYYVSSIVTSLLSIVTMATSFASPAWEVVYYDTQEVLRLSAEHPSYDVSILKPYSHCRTTFNCNCNYYCQKINRRSSALNATSSHLELYRDLSFTYR